jgi:hypothetical protein
MNRYTFLDIYAGLCASMIGSFIYSHLIKRDLMSLDAFLFSMAITVIFCLIIGPRIRNDAQ